MTNSAGYRVLASPCSGELREKGSKFVALVRPVSDRAEVGALRERLQLEHRDASHHCWAERIGWPSQERWSDAGEPRGTAGEPMVRVLRAGELSDVVAVVVRWFGGTKLGKGGLARAYAGVVAAALETGHYERRHLTSTLRLRMHYDRVGAVQRLVRPGEVDWVDETYGAEVTVSLRVRVELEDQVREALADLRVRAVPGSEKRS